MNPNSIAVIIDDPHCEQKDRGRLVKVVRRNDDTSLEADHEWLCRPLTDDPLAYSTGVHGPLVAIPSSFLLELREPGLVRRWA